MQCWPVVVVEQSGCVTSYGTTGGGVVAEKHGFQHQLV